MYNYTDLKRFDEAMTADIFNECEKADYSYLDYMYFMDTCWKV